MTRPSDTHLTRKTRSALLVIGIFALAAVPRLIRLGEFIGTDELYMWQLANRFFQALTQGRFADTIVHGYPAVTLMWLEALDVWIRYAAHWIVGRPVGIETLLGLDTPFSMLPDKQIVVALTNSAVVAGMFWLARKAYDLPAALIGAVLVAFDPFLLAESRIVRTEALASGLMVLSVLALLVFLRSSQRRYLFVSALMASLSTLTKISALLLIPIIGVALVLDSPGIQIEALPVPRDPGRAGANDRQANSWRVRGVNLVLWLLLFVMVFWTVWPAMWATPLDTARLVADFTEQAGEEGFAGRGVFFWGQIYPDDPGVWFYPVALLFRITPLTLLGVVLAAGFLGVRFLRSRTGTRLSASSTSDGWLYAGVTALLLYSLFFAAVMTLGAKKYDRYLMPLFPALDLVAGIGLAQVSSSRPLLSQFSRFRLFKSWHLAFAVVLIAQPLTGLPHVPYFYTYYNPLLGGIQQAARAIRVGYGEGLDVVARYMDSKPNAPRLKFASASSSKIGPLFRGETIPLDNLDGHWVQADYVLLYISQLQRGKHDPEIVAYLARHEPEYVLRLQGMEYGRVYPGPAAQYYSGSKLEGRGTLYGYDLSASQLQAGQVLTVTLYWRNEGQRAEDAFFVGLVDAGDYPWVTAFARPRPGFEEAARVRLELVESEATLHLPVGMPPGQYFIKMGFVTDNAPAGRASGQTLVGRFELSPDGDDLLVELPDSFASPSTWTLKGPEGRASAGAAGMSVPHRLDFAAPGVSLLGYDLAPAALGAGDMGWLTLFWQATRDDLPDYVVGLSLLNLDGREVTYWLGRPVYSGYPTTEWVSGQIVQDPWKLSLTPNVSPGEYTIQLTLYNAETQAPVAQTSLGHVSVLGQP